MIGLQAAFLQQLLNIPERQRISKMPADRTENERRFCLPPLEDRRSRSHFTILSRCQPGPTEVATQPTGAEVSISATKASHAARAPSIGYRVQDHHALRRDERRAKAPAFVRHPPD